MPTKWDEIYLKHTRQKNDFSCFFVCVCLKIKKNYKIICEKNMIQRNIWHLTINYNTIWQKWILSIMRITDCYSIDLGLYTTVWRLINYLMLLPIGFFKHSPFNGCFASAHRHLLFLSLGSIAQDVYGVLKQSESVLQPWTALAEKKIFLNLIYF